MTEDQSSRKSNKNSKSWLAKLANLFTDEPKSHNDLLQVLTEAHHNQLLDVDALNMMKGVLKVAELQVRQVMIPRAQMVVIPKTATLDEILPIIVESGHSRFPVVGEDKDELEGTLLAKDILKSFVEEAEAFDLKSLIRSAVVIPESKKINILLNEFRASRNHMAIVIDEYGGVAGLVTIEDILEEIVGEIGDEHDDEEQAFIAKISEQVFQVNALIPIADFNERFGCDLDELEYDTMGGLIASTAGRLPEVGEQIEVDGLLLKIIKSEKRRIELFEVDFS